METKSVMKSGETRVKVKLTGPNGSEDVVMLADTGASHSLISKELAERLGIEAVGLAEAEYADGSERTVEFGKAEFQLGRESYSLKVLIGQSSEPLLGLSTLEMFGLKVNPVTHTLEPSRTILYAIAG
jgi:clan AA aspartic protease